LLDSLRDEGVQLSSAGAQLHIIGGFPEEGMFEDIAYFGECLPNLTMFSGFYLLLQ